MISGNKKLLLYILIILIVGLGLIWFFVSRQITPKDQYELETDRAADLDIAEFSLHGEVLSTNANSFVFRTGWVVKTESGNRFAKFDKTVLFDDTTKIYTVLGSDRSEVSQTIESYLNVGDQVVVYGTGNPYPLKEIKATKIDVKR